MKTGTCTNWKLLRLEKNELISLKYHAKLELYILSIMQQLELDMKQQTGSKSGKEYIKAVYCHPAYLTYIQSTSCEMPGWMKHKLESRFPGEISITSDMQMIASLWKKVKRN